MNDVSESFSQLGSTYNKAPGVQVNHLSQNVANVTVSSAQDVKIGAKVWVPRNSASSVLGCPSLIQKLGMQCNGSSWKTENADFKKLPISGNAMSYRESIGLVDGSKPSAPQAGSTCFNGWEEGQVKDDKKNIVAAVDDDKVKGDADVVVFSDDNLFDCDSNLDGSGKFHETSKRSKWFKSFFNVLDKLTVDEISSLARQWHCPACKGGPGAIGWYRGMEPLWNHARTKKARRAKIHRIFAELLYKDMRRRGIPLTPIGEACGRWEGLNGKVKDYEIVWPPMVVIMNTRCEQEENGKWIGMGNQKLLDYFSSYAALKARHSYGPQGHRGMSVLIFEDSPAGYFEAARLHKHFKEQGRDRDAWDQKRIQFCSGGKRPLYGYMALKEDLDVFNEHTRGRSKLKFEMMSYQDVVESLVKQINKDSQKPVNVMKSFAKEQKQSQACAKSVCRLSEKLCRTQEENHAATELIKLLHEQLKEEMDSQEQFFRNQIKTIHQAIDAKEDSFEKSRQAKREKVMLSIDNAEDMHREESIEDFKKVQDREMEEFKAERDKLIKSHENKKAAFMKRYWEEQLVLEKELEGKLTQLMEKYTPDNHVAKTCSSHQF